MSNYRIVTPRTVLVLGSGGQKIGQSGESDQAGFQAIRALKAEGIRTVLVNPNMTAVQTSEGVADATYFLPVTAEFVTKVIEKEKPDSIIPHFGGRTAMACAMELTERGILERYNVQVLGTALADAEKAARRGDFIRAMEAAGVPVPRSLACETAAATLKAAELAGYPVMVRSETPTAEDRGAVCADRGELERYCERKADSAGGFRVEEWLGGWKEIELEILRDAMDNCVVACALENVDPLGIHTGESIVVSPPQTLTDSEFQSLREAAFRVARALNVIGGANVRFAVDPDGSGFRVFEASPKASRSTALASKATGIPVSWVAARVALGFSLSETENPLTGTTRLAAEPMMDYVAVKVPRWDMGRFANVDRHIGGEMKSVGEALAFGRTFEEALQKALRMADPASPGLACHSHSFRDVKEALRNPTDLRVYAVYSALREGWTADRIRKYAKIDRAFIASIDRLRGIEEELRKTAEAAPEQGGNARNPARDRLPGKELILRAKQAGFSDDQIGLCLKTRGDKIRLLRKELALRPAVKQIDSVAGEYPSKSGVFYMTYNGVTDDAKPTERGSLVIGSGPYHIGSSIEYDWSLCGALRTMREIGSPSILVNCNPEAVSTDSGLADRLYFEELSLERVLDVWEAERPEGVLLSYGGSLANELAIPLDRLKIPVLGTAPVDIDRAEDRNKFGALMDQLGIKQPEWAEVMSLQAAHDFAESVGYPVLMKSAAVDFGATMSVAWDEQSLKAFLAKNAHIGPERPAVISRYVENSKEIEIDAVANKGEILVYAISEHLENAGVHSGDATVVLPAQRIYLSTAQAIKKAARKIAKELEITGPFNIQFLAKNAGIQAIECTLRASRSLPFCSKVFRIDMAAMAVRAQLGAPVERVDGSRLDFDHVGVRAAQFSYSRLKGADPVAGVQMTSTGEVGCLGRGVRDAFMKAMLSTGYRIPKGKILLSTGPIEDKVDFIDSAKKLRAMGYEIVASSGTARFLQNNGVEAAALAWPLEEKSPNIAEAIRDREVDLVINIPKNNRETELKNDFLIRRMSVDYGIPLITNIKIAKQFTDALEWYKTRGLEVKSREEYL